MSELRTGFRSRPGREEKLRSAIDQLPLPLHDLALFQDPAVVAGEDLDEGSQRGREVVDDLVADLATRCRGRGG